MHSRRIGQIMVARGLLSQSQVDYILDHQRRDHRPFGQLAQILCDASEEAVCSCLAQQILSECPTVNLCQEANDPELLDLLSAVEAWDYLLLPLREDDDHIIFATTREALPPAIALLQRRINIPFKFVTAELHLLEQFIAERYDYEGIDVEDAA
jgi:hypothetical protein